MNDQELDALLKAAPTSAHLPRDPWPAVERRIGTRGLGMARGWKAAAVILLFGAGMASGWLAARRAGIDRPVVVGDLRSPAFMAATHVQETGSAYLAAVARLRDVGVTQSRSDVLAVTQGYEAALAVVEAVTADLGSSPVLETQAADLSGEAARVRAALGAQVSALLRRGDPR